MKKLVFIILTFVLAVTVFTVAAIATPSTVSEPDSFTKIITGQWEKDTVTEPYKFVGTGGTGVERFGYIYSGIADNGNKYAVYTPKDHTTNNSACYIDFGLQTSTKSVPDTKNTSGTKSIYKYNPSDYPYIVYDFDIMTPTGTYGNAISAVTFRLYSYKYTETVNSDTGEVTKVTGKMTDTSQSPLQVSFSSFINELDKTPYNWQHVTIVIEYAPTLNPDGTTADVNCNVNVYINGNHAATATNTANNAAKAYAIGVLPENIGFYSARMSGVRGSSGTKVSTTDPSYNANDVTTHFKDHIAIDNHSVSYYTKNYGDHAKIAAERFPSDYELPYKYTVATITDKEGKVTYYDDFKKAFAAANTSNTLTLFENVTESYMIDKAFNLNKNGFSFNLESRTGYIPTLDGDIYRYAKTDTPVRVIWDSCEGECDCYYKDMGHPMTEESVYAPGYIPKFYGSLPEIKLIGGIAYEFVGWTYEKNGRTPEEIVAVTDSDAATGVLRIYPVYTLTLYSFEVTTSAGINYYLENEYDTAIAEVASGGTIKLLTDVTVENGYTFTKANANIVFDLNGHSFKRYSVFSNLYEAIFDEASGTYKKGASKGTTDGGAPQTFTINASGLTFTIKNTGKKEVSIFTYTLCRDAWVDENGDVRGYDNLRDSKDIGKSYNPGTVLFGYRGAKNTRINIEGEGISYYGGTIINNEWGGNQNTNSLYIDGGAYYSVVDTYLAMIAQQAGGTVDVRNATIVGNGRPFARVANVVNTSNVTVVDFTFTNCKIIDSFAQNYNTFVGEDGIKLIDCRYYARLDQDAGLTLGRGTYANNLIGVKTAEGMINVDRLDEEEIDVIEEASFLRDENDNPTFNFTKTKKTYSFIYRIADPELDCAEIYWIDTEGYVFDVTYALKNDTLKLPSLRVPSGDGFRGVTNVTSWLNSEGKPFDFYIGNEDQYEFFPILPAEEEREYAACMTSAMFNMVYFTNFAYNVYVPKADGVEILSLGGTVPTRTVWIKNVEYWVYTTYAPSTKGLDDTVIELDYEIEGASYSVKFKPSAIFYAETIAYDPYAEDDELELIACLIRYIEESYKAHFGALDDALSKRVADFYDVCSPSPYPEKYPDAELFNSEVFVDLIENIYLMVESGRVKFVFNLTDEAVNQGYKIKAKGLTSALYTEDGKTFVSNNTPLRTHVMETFTVSVVDSDGNTVKVEGDFGESLYATSKYSLAAYVSGTGNTLAKALYAFGEALRVYYPVDPDNYQIDAITLFGEDISDYTIVADSSDAEEYYVAEELQALIYSKSGYWLEIVPHSAADKSIVINLRAKTGAEGFSVTFEEGRIELICEYKAFIHEEAMRFFNQKFAVIGDLSLTASDNYSKNIRDIFYSDFGAKGDGVTDDVEAIRAAHVHANKTGQTVCADEGATYYIGPMTNAITVRTDVNWKDAEFIIDDRFINPEDEARSVKIFNVSSGDSPKTYTASTNKAIAEINAAAGIDASAIKKLDMGFGRPLMLQIFNDNHRNYVRYGANANSGAVQQEVILVDADGNIDPSTPIMFDYEKVTKITVYEIDATPITVEGGIFTTRANAAPRKYTSYARNIQVTRPNTTVRNITHYVTDEGSTGAPYEGFLKVHTAYNVTFENCLLTGHKIYKNESDTGMGTYDISATSTVNARWINCRQTNFFNNEATESTTKNTHWGIMGSSYCKNLSFEGCRLTRFDAHAGIYNVDIRNSELIHITVVGGGTLRVENSKIFNNNFVQLRTDYGNFWHGNIILRNNVMAVGSSSSAYLITGTWYNHDFGYPTALPETTVVDGLSVYKHFGNKTPTTAKVNLYGDSIISNANNIIKDYFDVKDADGNVIAVIPNLNKMPAPERVVIRNCDVDIALPDGANYPWFENTVFEVTEKGETPTLCSSHFDLGGDLLCDDCSAPFTPCADHSDLNRNGICAFCHADVEIPCSAHIDTDMNEKCDICKNPYVCQSHTDTDKNNICDVCGGAYGCFGKHSDENADNDCDVCKKKIS